MFSRVPCDLCRSSDSSTILSAPINASELQSPAPDAAIDYHIQRCNSCGLVYLNPRPDDEEMRSFYTGHLSGSIEEYRDSFLKTSAYNLYYYLTRRIPRATHGKILDVGCGIGMYVRYLIRSGWDAVGIEPEKRMYEIAKNSLHLPVYNTILEEFACPDETFDVITMYQTLEHVPSPLSVLKAARRLLKKNGLLIIGNVPNFNSMDQKLFGRYNTALGIPYHTYHFTEKTLKRCCEQADFNHTGTEFELFVPTQLSYNLLNYLELKSHAAMGMTLKLFTCASLAPLLLPLYALFKLTGTTFTFKMYFEKHT